MTPEQPPEAAPDRPPRSARAWVVLLVAWAFGLLIWTIYIAAYVYVVIRVLA